MIHNLGSPIAQEETIGPTQVTELLGMLIDSIRLKVGLPWDKIKHIIEALCRWECRKQTAVTYSYSPLCMQRSPLLQRMIALTKELVKPYCHIRLNNGFREDLNRMWKQLIDNWNGTNMFMNEAWEDSNTLALYTDASGTEDLGGICWKE